MRLWLLTLPVLLLVGCATAPAGPDPRYMLIDRVQFAYGHANVESVITDLCADAKIPEVKCVEFKAYSDHLRSRVLEPTVAPQAAGADFQRLLEMLGPLLKAGAF